MSQTIAAIQTRYKGYLFRSRLEARWAVFFDKCHQRFVYEDQGFQLSSGPYLPDFYLLDHPRGFIEVKPASMLPVKHFEFGVSPIPIRDDFPLEVTLIYELSKATGTFGAVVYGDPLDAGFDYGCTPTGGAVYTSRQKGVLGGSFIFALKNYEAAVAAREARFEHGATA